MPSSVYGISVEAGTLNTRRLGPAMRPPAGAPGDSWPPCGTSGVGVWAVPAGAVRKKACSPNACGASSAVSRAEPPLATRRAPGPEPCTVMPSKPNTNTARSRGRTIATVKPSTANVAPRRASRPTTGRPPARRRARPAATSTSVPPARPPASPASAGHAMVSDPPGRSAAARRNGRQTASTTSAPSARRRKTAPSASPKTAAAVGPLRRDSAAKRASTACSGRPP